MNAKNEKFEKQTVYLDGCAFYDCEFVQCTLVYSGIIPVTLVGCTLSNCRMEFAGPAANTLQYLYSLSRVNKEALTAVQNILAPILEDRRVGE
jgi:hypothetical protein